MLCRQWQTRVKGRDWYDFLWFVQRDTLLDLRHLETRLRSYGYYTDNGPLTKNMLQTMLLSRIDSIDLDLAREDISKFIKDQRSLDAWSKQLFIAATKQINMLD